MESRRSFLKKSGLLMAAGSLPLAALSQEGQNIVITLNVDTSTIDKKDVNASCNFGQEEGVPNEEFTVSANIGDTITWQGISVNAPETDVVNIVSINYEGGKNIFGQNILSSNRTEPRRVTGKVQSATPEGQDYKYKISFTVSNNGRQRNGTFHIDPKIQVH
ncbi:MAG: hypothetical protein JNN04_01675 [Cyclobacteriaceae bacterium]|nr:hypothetical protein [Cyclobacteriaceae bacterium]